jgi:hypothetical protein
MHFKVLVEELSMEAALDEVLPRVIPDHTFNIHVHQGKPDLLRKVENRLRAYARMTWPGLRVVIIVDRDGDDCRLLKQRLVDACVTSGCDALCRVAIEELEAWFFGRSRHRCGQRESREAILSRALLGWRSLRKLRAGR